MLLKISDILSTFGAFLAVLIAIEIFINIRMYLTADVIPVRLVVTVYLRISRCRAGPRYYILAAHQTY